MGQAPRVSAPPTTKLNRSHPRSAECRRARKNQFLTNTMLGEPENQFSLTRVALSTCGRAKKAISYQFP